MRKMGIFLLFLLIFLVGVGLILHYSTSLHSNLTVYYPAYLERDLFDIPFGKDIGEMFVNRTGEIENARILVISHNSRLSRKIILETLEEGKILVIVGNKSEYYLGRGFMVNPQDVHFRFSVLLNGTDNAYITVAYLNRDKNALITKSIACEAFENCTSYYSQKLAEILNQISKNDK